MKDLGVVPPGSTIYIEFDTFGADGQALTMSGLAVTDVEVYKDGSVTQRSSDAGYTLLDTDGIDFDTVTGIHGLSISLADNTDAGFWAAGSHYRVVIASITVNTQTVSFTAATFRIGYTAAVLNTTIATLASQTSFTLTAGPAEDDALNGMWAVIHDVASAVQKSAVQILDYTGATKTVTLAAGATFTAAATDNISIMGPMPLQPTVTGRQANFAADGDFAGNIDGTLATLTTYTGNTPQTGDSFARIGANGASLSAVPWNAAWDAEVESEVNDALVANNLDHLVLSAVDTDFATTVHLNSVIGHLADNGTIATFDRTNDSLESIRNKLPIGLEDLVITGNGITVSVIDEDVAVLDLDDTIRAAMGLATANADTQLAAIKSDTAAILLDTGTDGVVLNAAGLATDAVQEIRNAITGGAYALNTSATGSIRVVDGIGTDEINTSGGDVSVLASSVRSAVGLASANLDTQLDALPTAAENASGLLDLVDAIESGITVRKALRAISAKAAGLVSGAATGTEVVKGIGQTSGGTTRMTATVDGSGNISDWALNL